MSSVLTVTTIGNRLFFDDKPLEPTLFTLNDGRERWYARCYRSEQGWAVEATPPSGDGLKSKCYELNRGGRWAIRPSKCEYDGPYLSQAWPIIARAFRLETNLFAHGSITGEPMETEDRIRTTGCDLQLKSGTKRRRFLSKVVAALDCTQQEFLECVSRVVVGAPVDFSFVEALDDGSPAALRAWVKANYTFSGVTTGGKLALDQLRASRIGAAAEETLWLDTAECPSEETLAPLTYLAHRTGSMRSLLAGILNPAQDEFRRLVEFDPKDNIGLLRGARDAAALTLQEFWVAALELGPGIYRFRLMHRRDNPARPDPIDSWTAYWPAGARGAALEALADTQFSLLAALYSKFGSAYAAALLAAGIPILRGPAFRPLYAGFVRGDDGIVLGDTGAGFEPLGRPDQLFRLNLVEHSQQLAANAVWLSRQAPPDPQAFFERSVLSALFAQGGDGFVLQGYSRKPMNQAQFAWLRLPAEGTSVPIRIVLENFTHASVGENQCLPAVVSFRLSSSGEILAGRGEDRLLTLAIQPGAEPVVLYEDRA